MLVILVLQSLLSLAVTLPPMLAVIKAVKYGVTGRHVYGLEVVMPDGDIITYGGKM